MQLSNRTALITGSTSGIGAETARLFSREGAAVVITGRQPALGARIVGEIEQSGGRARYINGDLTDRDAIRRIADEAGDVDILVNNAAFVPAGPVLDQDSDSFDRAFESNVRAPYFLAAAIAPRMIARGGGSIVNVSSMAAKLGMPGLSVYAASKAALESFTRTWAAEFASFGVRVNTVSPGPTATEKSTAKRGAARDDLGRTTLLSRSANTSEIAEVILFLASDRSSYVTGATFAADGGRTAI